MHELRFPLDPCNPGQFFACCGLIELFDLVGAKTSSHFIVNWREPRTAQFVLTSEFELDVGLIASSINASKYEPLARPSSEGKTPEKDAVAPVHVYILGAHLMLDWWLECFHERSCSLKCWAGQVTTQKLISILPRMVSNGISFDDGLLTTTRFGIDPRSAWVALNLGYSPNEQGQESRTYPAVEMLGAFGLQGFRPAGNRNKGFIYNLWHSPLPRIVARSVCARPWSGLDSSAYRFGLGGRGSYKYFTFAEPYPSS